MMRMLFQRKQLGSILSKAGAADTASSGFREALIRSKSSSELGRNASSRYAEGSMGLPVSLQRSRMEVKNAGFTSASALPTST